MKLPAETLAGKMNVVASAAAASAEAGENRILVPGATVGAATVVVVALAANVKVPEQFNLPWSICPIAWFNLVRSTLLRPGT